MSDDIDYEIDIFATDKEKIDEIEEIREINNKQSTTSLKIVHSQLTSIKGLQDFRSIKYVDLSSNKITSINIYFKPLKQLKILNLSCNSLTNLNGIENLAHLLTMFLLSCPEEIYQPLNEHLRSQIYQLREVDRLPPLMRQEVVSLKEQMLALQNLFQTLSN